MYKGKNVHVIIGAGGRGTRMRAAIPKQFLYVGGKTIIERTVDKFYLSEFVDSVTIVTAGDYLDYTKEIFSEYDLKSITVIPGGEQRQDSIYAAVKHLEKSGISDDDIIIVHDAVRPYFSETLIEKTAEAAFEYGAAVTAVIPKDTIRNKDGGTLVRSDLYCVQTPQAFGALLLTEAYKRAFADGYYGTDDAGLVERLGAKVTVVPGEDGNVKITTPEDLRMETRIGTGFDVHKLVEGRKLIIGGVEIEYEKGLLGHSDADVLLHALTDAILGAACMGDIGRLYPDSDPAYKGASSIILLQRAWNAVRDRGYGFINADITVICEKPKMSPYIDRMRENIANALCVDVDSVSIKATTTEKLGFTGRGEGIAAQAVCMLSSFPI